MKKIFNDLITWNDKKELEMLSNKKYKLDLKKFKINTLKSNDIINKELILLLLNKFNI